MNDVVLRAPLDAQIQYVERLAMADILPTAFRQKPANILYVLAFANDLGIGISEALQGIHVIDSKPSMSADLMQARAMQAGCEFSFETTPDSVTVTLHRMSKLTNKIREYTASFSMEDAKRAGLLNRKNWISYPADMMRSRAISRVIRMGATDLMHGIIYTPDEVENFETSPGVAAEVVTEVKPSLPAKTTGKISKSMLTEIGALFKDLGVQDTTAKAELISQALGEPYAGDPYKLTVEEGAKIVELLHELSAQTIVDADQEPLDLDVPGEPVE